MAVPRVGRKPGLQDGSGLRPENWAADKDNRRGLRNHGIGGTQDMSAWEFIIAFSVAAGICTAIMLIANLIYDAYERRKFRRECEKMFDFYGFLS